MSAALGRVGLGLLMLAAGAAAARAHIGGSTGYAAITVSRSTVRYKLSLPTTALPSDLAEALRLFSDGELAGGLGVEIGQGLVVAVTLPALYPLRGTPWEPSVTKSSSLAILLFGLVLFVERAFL